MGMPWNGIHLNINHLCNFHSDNNDTHRLPALTVHLGPETELRLHGNKEADPTDHKKLVVGNGGISLIDSLCGHEVLELDNRGNGIAVDERGNCLDGTPTIKSSDKHGRHMRNRCSLVLCATKEKDPCVSERFMTMGLQAKELQERGALRPTRHESKKKRKKWA